MKKRMRKVMALVLSAVMALTAVPAAGMISQAASPQEHIDLTRQVAADGMVLMENNGALPIAEGETVAMFGRAMIDYVRGGGGSGATVVDYTRNILQGMKIKAEEGKIQLYQPLVDFYTGQVTTNGITDDANITVSDDLLDGAAANAQTAVVTIGRYSSEGSDRSAGKGDYYLSDAETELLTRVAAAFDKTVVVLNVGAVLDTSWIKAIPGIDAVLMAWQAGMEGGLATADVLVGDVNPSGKFVDTFAKSYEDYPSSDTFYESNNYVNYEEDIYVGYRYFETFDPDYEKVNYEFGYGLSYTTFDISDVTVAVEGDDIVSTAKVTNTGAVAGKEVVQVYFSAPQGRLGKPAKELAAFDKTALLEPGESEVLTMSFPISDMSSYDDTGAVQKSAYVLEAGDYNIYVGNSIKNAGTQGIRYTYTVDQDTVTEQLSEQCAPTQLTKRLMATGEYVDMPIPEGMDPHYTVAAEGITRVESENFIGSSNDLTIETYYNENMEQQRCLAMMNQAGKYAEYELTAEQAGKYSVIICQANGYPTLTNCFNVYVNDELQIGVRFDAEQTGDGSGKSEWYNFEESEPFYINLQEGVNIVRFVANRNNPNYEYMLLERVGETEDYYKKAVSATGQTKIQAEDFDTSGAEGSNAVRTENFNNNTQTCLAYMNYEGNSVSYYLKVEEAGDYDVILNVANGRAGFDFDPGIEINGEKIPATITAIQTGNGDGAGEWYNFENLTPVTVTLPEGNVILTLKCSETNKYPNIDYILLERKAAAQAKARTARAVTGDPGEKIMLLDVYHNPELMDAFLDQLTDEQLANLLQGQPNTGVANTGGIGNLMEYGIPNAMTADGPQGIRIGTTCTAWPVSTLLACTWDVDLVEQVGKAAAIEAHNNGIDIWLAPGMNIHRDPLCGRNFEYYSEDPLIAGKMAAAITKGCQSEGVSITLKHFTVNNKETNRNSVDTRVSERALREIYLKGFEIAVKEAHPWSIMTSYNFLNGIETSENKELLTNITRGEWGYEGIFMTDWGNNSNHAREVLAGNDVKMPSGSPATILAAVEKGIVTREDMEACAERIVKMIMKVNIFKDKILDPPTVEIHPDAGVETRLKAAENIIWSETLRAQDTQDEDGGKNIGYCDAGAWAEYQIHVAETGMYRLAARSASNAGGGAFEVLVDGEVLAAFEAINTGGWQKWITLDGPEVFLEEGTHRLKIAFTESGSNLNWLSFSRVLDLDAKKATLYAVTNAYKDLDVSLYTAESAAALAAAVENGKQVLADSAASDTDIIVATKEILKAGAGLVLDTSKLEGDAAAAQAAADAAQATANAAQTAAGAAQTAADAARTAADNAQATADAARTAATEAKAAADKAQAELDEAKQDVNTSKEKLAELETAAAAAKAKVDEAAAAAATSQKKADDAATAAGAAQTTADEAKAAAAEAKAAAEAAKTAAVTEAKRAILSVALNAYKDLNTNVYTAGSAAVLSEALTAGQEVFDNTSSTDEEILTAATNILKAAASLVFDTTSSRKEIQAAKDAAEEAKKAAEEIKAAYETNRKQEEEADIAEGQSYDSGDYIYRVLSKADMTVEVTGLKNTGLTKISVYSSVTLGGKSYKVVAVAPSAFKNNKKVTAVTIAKNVETIGQEAFAGCTSLKKVTINSTALKEIGSKAFSGDKKLKSIVIRSKVLKKVGKNAFRGIDKKAVIRVPSTKVKAYTKLLAKKGQSSSVKIRK